MVVVEVEEEGVAPIMRILPDGKQTSPHALLTSLVGVVVGVDTRTPDMKMGEWAAMVEGEVGTSRGIAACYESKTLVEILDRTIGALTNVKVIFKRRGVARCSREALDQGSREGA
jgi:hypothetical protein